MQGLGLEVSAICEAHMSEALHFLPPDGGDLRGECYSDEMTGLPLRPALVRQARREEMANREQMKGLRALTSVDTRLWSQPGLPARFVDANKDEPGAHVVRARLVVCETTRRCG